MGSAFRPSDQAQRGRPGFALIATIWISGLLALASLDLLGAARRDVSAARLLTAQARAEAAAEAGIALGAQALLADGTLHGVIERELDDLRITVRIEPESNRVDLNAAPRERLRALLRAATGSDAEADRLIAAIEDWRDGDDARRPGGAEMADYLRAGAAVLPRDADFESVGELVHVQGMSAVLVEAVEGRLTVWGRTVPGERRTSDSLVGAAFRITSRADSGGGQPGRGAKVSAGRMAVVRPTGSVARPLLWHASGVLSGAETVRR